MKFGASLLLIVVLLTGTTASADSNQYLQAGIPATDRVWTGADYARTLEILQSGAVPLPTYADPDGEALLDRMYALENFALAQKESLPIELRLNEAGAIMAKTAPLMFLYVAAANRGAKLHREMTAGLVFMLQSATKLVPLFNEFVARMPDFENQPKRVEGRKIFLGGIVKMFSGAEISLSETPFYTNEDVSLRLKAMADTLPTLKMAFTDQFREELKIKMIEHRDRMSDPADIANINRMLQELASP